MQGIKTVRKALSNMSQVFNHCNINFLITGSQMIFIKLNFLMDSVKSVVNHD